MTKRRVSVDKRIDELEGKIVQFYRRARVAEEMAGVNVAARLNELVQKLSDQIARANVFLEAADAERIYRGARARARAELRSVRKNQTPRSAKKKRKSSRARR